jgi:hypothetical protein
MLEEFIEQLVVYHFGGIRPGEAIGFSQESLMAGSEVVRKAACSQRLVLIAVGHTGTRPVHESRNTDACAVNDDVWQAEIAVSKDEVFFRGALAQHLLEKRLNRHAQPMRVEILRVDYSAAHAMLCQRDPLVEPHIERAIRAVELVDLVQSRREQSHECRNSCREPRIACWSARNLAEQQIGVFVVSCKGEDFRYWQATTQPPKTTVLVGKLCAEGLVRDLELARRLVFSAREIDLIARQTERNLAEHCSI